MDDDNQRNLLRFVYLDEGARKLIPDWQERARRLLAEFRADYGHSFREPRVKSFIDALGRDSQLFAQAWNDQDVKHRAAGVRTFNHPEVGLRCFEQHTFASSERPDYKLVMLTPVSG